MLRKHVWVCFFALGCGGEAGLPVGSDMGGGAGAPSGGSLAGPSGGSRAIEGGRGGSGGVTIGEEVTNGGSAAGMTAVATPPCQPMANCNPDVAASEEEPPWGIWSMVVQYGPVGVPTTPTIPLQVEMREDGTAYRWLCVGKPSNGSVTTACAVPTRGDCLIGTNAWDGTRWRVDFPEARVGNVPEQGQIIPDGEGHILISYINPTYSGALFRPVGDATADGPACKP